MKKLLIKIFSAILILPCLVLCACSSTKIPSINLDAYYNSPIEATVWTSSVSTKKSLTLNDISSKKPVTTKLDAYLQFNFTGVADYLYRMYIEKIEFYVYSNMDANEMTLNLSISNLAKTDDISNKSTFKNAYAIVPKAEESVLVTFEINRIVAVATGSDIQIDILESKNNTITDDAGNPTGFKWIIHNFKVYGEHRTN